MSSLGFKLKTIIDHRPHLQRLDIVGSVMSICIYEYDHVFFGSLFFNDETPLPSGYNHKTQVIDSAELVEYIQRYKPILSMIRIDEIWLYTQPMECVQGWILPWLRC